MSHISRCKHGIGMAMCDECYPKTKLQQGWEEGYAKMDKQHKWHKEIHAWADGAEIEARFKNQRTFKEKGFWTEWEEMDSTCRFSEDDWWEYRIKPQPNISEFAHIPYWLCCGSLDIRHHATSCSEAKAGNPERCRFGTVEEHQKHMEKPKEPQYLYAHRTNEGDITFEIDEGVSVVGYQYIGKIKLEVDDD